MTPSVYSARLLRSRSRSKAVPYVICGKRQGRHLVNLEKPWRRIRAAAHLADDPLKAASEAVGRHIAAAMDGKGGEVVDFARSRGARHKPR